MADILGAKAADVLGDRMEKNASVAQRHVKQVVLTSIDY